MRGVVVLVVPLLAVACGDETATSTSTDPAPVGSDTAAKAPNTTPQSTTEVSGTTPAPEANGLGPQSTPGASDPVNDADEANAEASESELVPMPLGTNVMNAEGVTPTMGDVEADPETNDIEAEPETNDSEADPETNDSETNPETNDIETNPETNDIEPNPETNDGEADPQMPSEPTEVAPTDAAPAVPLSFANDIWPVWNMSRDPVFVYRGMGSYSGCTDVGVCHGGTSPGAQLSMPDPDTAYSQLIDVPSVSSLCAGTQRVVVGDPDNSCLILFYVGRLGKDDLDWVDDTEIELMREWIRQGALP